MTTKAIMESLKRTKEIGLWMTQTEEAFRNILAENMPSIRKDEGMTTEEINNFFDNDPEAPLILVVKDKDNQPETGMGIRIAVNAKKASKELTARGFGPDVCEFHGIAVKALMRTAALIMQETLYSYQREVNAELPVEP